MFSLLLPYECCSMMFAILVKMMALPQLCRSRSQGHGKLDLIGSDGASQHRIATFIKSFCQSLTLCKGGFLASVAVVQGFARLSFWSHRESRTTPTIWLAGQVWPNWTRTKLYLGIEKTVECLFLWDSRSSGFS